MSSYFPGVHGSRGRCCPVLCPLSPEFLVTYFVSNRFVLDRFGLYRFVFFPFFL